MTRLLWQSRRVSKQASNNALITRASASTFAITIAKRWPKKNQRRAVGEKSVRVRNYNYNASTKRATERRLEKSVCNCNYNRDASNKRATETTLGQERLRLRLWSWRVEEENNRKNVGQEHSRPQYQSRHVDNIENVCVCINDCNATTTPLQQKEWIVKQGRDRRAPIPTSETCNNSS